MSDFRHNENLTVMVKFIEKVVDTLKLCLFDIRHKSITETHANK